MKRKNGLKKNGVLALGASVLAAAISRTAVAALPEDDFVVWPDRGFYPAYAKATVQPRFTAYSTLDIGFDDNFFRLSDAPGVSVFASDDREERFVKLGFGARGNFDLSLQQFVFNVHADRYMFDRFSDLDTWVYTANADWLWKIGDRLHGDIGYFRTQRLPDFAELQFVTEDVILQQQGHASVAIRLLSRVEAQAFVEEARYEHDDPAFAEFDNKVRTGTVGLVYTSPVGTSFGGQYRESRGDYPVRQAVGTRLIDNEFQEKEANFIFNKNFDNPGGFDLRVGHTERLHEQLPQRDFSGGTGKAHLRYALRPKMTLDFTGYRELRAIEELSASYALVRGGSFGPSWALTSKFVLQASYVYEKRRLGGDPGFVVTNTQPREDTSRIGRVAAGYHPSDHIQVGLSYERGMRDANVLFADYEYNLVTLHVVASL